MSNTTHFDSAVVVGRQSDATREGVDYHELVGLASLAASSHNTQPWKFKIEDGRIRIFPDYARRCPIVDPNDAHLFKSLGCATENLVHAAAAQGLATPGVHYDAVQDCVVVPLVPDASVGESELSRAISQRQCTKSVYDGKSLTPGEYVRLERAAQGQGVQAILLRSDAEKEAVIRFVNEGNVAQLSDRSFRRELKRWIRANPRESMKSRDGISAATSGKPSIPSWLSGFVLDWVLTPRAQCKTDARNIRSSAGIAVFLSETDSKPAWVETGRCFERFALRATAEGIRTAFVNQLVEVPPIRRSFQQWLKTDDRYAQLIVRFGRAPKMPYSVRRPVVDVLLPEQPWIASEGSADC